MKAFILAAGLGERLRPITEAWPKPVIPILNIPMIYYAMMPFLKYGVKEIIVNTHHLADVVKANVDPLKALVPITVVQEKDELLGSGGGIWNIKKNVEKEEDFFVANGDEIFFAKNRKFLEEALDCHKKNKCLATLVTMEHKEVGTKYGGVWVDSNDNVKGFGKSSPAPRAGYKWSSLSRVHDPE